MTIKQAKRSIILTIIFVILILIIFTVITRPTSIRIGKSYADKTVDPDPHSESFPIYNIESNYQPGDVRTLSNISSK